MNGVGYIAIVCVVVTAGAKVEVTYPEDWVELRGGEDDLSGNVFAVNSDGFFGPVCDDGWDPAAAMVVCRWRDTLVTRAVNKAYKVSQCLAKAIYMLIFAEWDPISHLQSMCQQRVSPFSRGLLWAM